MTDDDICGEPTGENGDGPPCELKPGWGRDADSGPCKHHTDDKVRPRKLTHELQERIAHDLEAGMPAKHAAEKNGIHEDTYYRWIRLGKEEDEGILSEFTERVTRAQGHGMGTLVTDAVSFARMNEDARALLKAYQQIRDGQRSQEEAGEDEERTIPLVVPANAMPNGETATEDAKH